MKKIKKALNLVSFKKTVYALKIHKIFKNFDTYIF